MPTARFSSRLRRAPAAAVAVVQSAVGEFLRLRAPEAGAAIAFYALFSLFPLLLLMVTLLGFFLEQEQVYSELLDFIEPALPLAREDFMALAEENLRVIVTRRGSVGLLAAAGLLWAGSAVFGALVRNINRAWHTTAAPMNLIQGRLIGVGLIGILVALVPATFAADALLKLLARWEVPFAGGLHFAQTSAWLYLTGALPILSSFLLYLGLYRWVPNTRVRWSEAAAGAVTATIAWHMAIASYTWAIQEGMVNYQVVYGSLATVVVTMFWIFLSALILLFGAHLGASISRYRST